MGSLGNFETQRHGVASEVLLVCCFDFLEVAQGTFIAPVLHFHKCDALLSLSWLDLHCLYYQFSLGRLNWLVLEAVFRV